MEKYIGAPHFNRKVCQVCGRKVSTCGFGWVAHMRRHVSEGRMTEEGGGYDPLNGRRQRLRFTLRTEQQDIFDAST